MAAPHSPEGPPPPISALEPLRRAVGPRVFTSAVMQPYRYVSAPVLAEEGRLLRAALTLDDDRTDPRDRRAARVELLLAAGSPVTGLCSTCPQSFGPCVHLATLAIDIAISPSLREAVEGGDAAGEDAARAAARAPARRAVLGAELRLERALAAWSSRDPETVRIEIAAGPALDAETPGRGYGERRGDGPTLSLTVRRPGERKLLSAREILGLSLHPRDRRVLEHGRDRGNQRKAVFAAGIDASIAIEAMRAHRAVFAEGYKRLLDFRATPVRPLVTLGAPGHPGAPSASEGLEVLRAFWSTEDGAVRVPADEAVFFAGPFPYVWASGGAIFPVADDVDPQTARLFEHSPVLMVPRSRLRDTGAALLRAARGKGAVVPPHEAFGLPPLERPRIVLRLAGEPLAVSGDLVAIYAAREVSLLAPPRADDEDGRDLDREERARARVERAGLVQPPPEDDPESTGTIGAFGEGAVRFWQGGLAELRAAAEPPIEIQLAEALARVRVTEPVAARVRIALEGDWLDTRVEFRSEELAVEMDVIRAAIARKRRWVTLSDGTLARISAELESLVEEAVEVLGPGGKKLLPAHQLGRLDRWIEQNDGSMDVAVQSLRGRLRALAVSAEPVLPEGLRATLRPYQRHGVAWLQFLKQLGAGGILADDMGLGKTIMALAFLLERKEREGPAPSLVVCPTSVATNWLREAARFAPGLRTLLLHGPSRDLAAIAEHDLVVTTYGLLRRDVQALGSVPFRCVVLDEAQNIKNAASATTHAANALVSPMRLALTGTPVENRLGELWSLASFANPGILGSLGRFEARFERPIAADRESPVAAELRAVVRPFLLRRTKDEVLRDLPPKIEVDRVVTLHHADKRMYDALAHALRESIAKDIRKHGMAQSTLSVFTALTRLRQMACDPRLVDAAAETTGPSAKRAEFLDLARELAAEGRRALVFSQFVQLLTLWRRDLEAEGIAYEYLDGSTTKRDEVVDRFQRGSAPLFLISLKAGGAGLNLTAADTVIHCDPWWNPAVEDQATDRAHRIGQSKTVTVVRLIARGTIEEKILTLKAKKRELTRAVIDDDAGALAGLTEDDVRTLLGAAEDGPDDDDDDEPAASPDDALATARRVLSPEYPALVAEVKEWLAVTGLTKAQLAARVDIPTTYAVRLARGEPFPCSRATAERIRARIRAY